MNSLACRLPDLAGVFPLGNTIAANTTGGAVHRTNTSKVDDHRSTDCAEPMTDVVGTNLGARARKRLHEAVDPSATSRRSVRSKRPSGAVRRATERRTGDFGLLAW